MDESPFDADGDGLYTNVAGGDDPGELETLPPYRFPLRGIEVRAAAAESRPAIVCEDVKSLDIDGLRAAAVASEVTSAGR